VTLTWQAAQSTANVTVVGYNVYRRRDDPSTVYVKIASRVPGLRYEDELVRSGETYTYAITAIDRKGRESRFSEIAKIKIR